jgi:hypothetical protein
MTLLGFIFGGIPEGFLGLCWLVVNLVATRRVLTHLKAVPMFVWLAVIWGIPCLGGVVALFGVRKQPPTTIQIDPPKSE